MPRLVRDYKDESHLGRSADQNHDRAEYDKIPGVRKVMLLDQILSLLLYKLQLHIIFLARSLEQCSSLSSGYGRFDLSIQIETVGIASLQCLDLV